MLPLAHALALCAALLSGSHAPAAGSPAGSGAQPATPGSPIASNQLLGALPSDTFATVYIPNPKATMAQRETNRWVGFALEPQWDPILRRFLASLGDGIAPDEVAAWRIRVMEAMSDSTGAVAFFGGPIDLDAPPETAGLIVLGGDSCAMLLRQFIGTNARARELAGGAEVLVSEGVRTDVYYRKGNVSLILSTPSAEQSMATVETCLAGLEAGKVQGPLALESIQALRPDGAAFEFALDLSGIWRAVTANMTPSEGKPDAFQARMLASAASIKWAYGAGTFGIDEEATWSLFAPYDPSSLVGEALGFFGQADRSLLASAPKAAISATVGAFDMSEFATWALEQTEELSEEMHTRVMGGLGAAQTAIGIDPMEDVLQNMTGQFLGFSTASDADDAESLLGLSGAATTTLVVGFEDTDPLLDLTDTLVEMSGMGEAIRSETLELPGDEGEEIELYRVDASTGFPVTVGLGGGRMILSTDADGSEAYLQLLKSPTGGARMLDDEKLKKAVDAASGAVVTIQPTAAVADVLDGMAEMVDAMTASINDAWDDQENDDSPAQESITEITASLTALVRQYFEGTTTTEVKFAGGLMRMESRSR